MYGNWLPISRVARFATVICLGRQFGRPGGQLSCHFLHEESLILTVIIFNRPVIQNSFVVLVLSGNTTFHARPRVSYEIVTVVT